MTVAGDGVGAEGAEGADGENAQTRSANGSEASMRGFYRGSPHGGKPSRGDRLLAECGCRTLWATVSDPPRRNRVTLLASLYFSQGLPFGFFAQAFPVLMRQQGVSLEGVGLSSLLNLPWALKFLWAPWVDRTRSERFGPRRAWIVGLQTMTVVTLLGLALADLRPGTTLVTLAVGVLLLNLLAATQDVATDGLAVNLLARGDRGLGNAVQVGGYRLGMVVGGGALLMAFDDLGWTGAFVVMAAMLAAATVPIVLHREAPSPAPERAPLGASLWSFLDVLRRPGMGRWLVVLVTWKAGDALASAMVKPFCVDLGMGLAEVGLVLGAVGSGAALLGAVFGGWLVDRLERRPALVLCGLFQALAVLAWVPPTLGLSDRPWLIAVSAFEHFAGSTATVALFSAMMDRCRPANAGADYTTQASVVVVTSGVAGSASGFVAANLGYTMHFGLSFLLCLVGVALLWELVPPQSTTASMRPST